MCACTHTDPRVFQSLLGRDSFGWVDGQHLVDQVFGLRSHRVPLWGGKLQDGNEQHILWVTVGEVGGGRCGERQAHIVRSSFDLLVEFVLVLVPERRVSNQKDVEDHTYTQTETQLLSE